jgi:hypothetical protein
MGQAIGILSRCQPLSCCSSLTQPSPRSPSILRREWFRSGRPLRFGNFSFPKTLSSNQCDLSLPNHPSRQVRYRRADVAGI